MPNKFSFIDLFAGIGGFKMALSRNGGRCLGFSEISNDAINIYCENHNTPQSQNLGDITKIKELPEHDILTAGVPCQSWSIAGKNLGFDDDRGQLWNDTIFLLQQSKPKVFIFENVKGAEFPYIGGLYSGAPRIAEALDIPDAGKIQHRDLQGVFSKAMFNPVAHTVKESGSVKDVIKLGSEASLGSLPIPTFFELDSGPFITGAVGISRHPDTGQLNVGFYRTQILDDNTEWFER